VLRERVGGKSPLIESLDYGSRVTIGGITLSLHPSGHLLGAAQVRLEKKGYVCVVTGDYKRQPDSTCAPFEVLPCHAFFTECTFGLPVYQWPKTDAVAAEINHWWIKNKENGLTSVLFSYALGKAQRVLSLVDDSIGPIGVHGSISRFDSHYEKAGVQLAKHQRVTADNLADFKGKGLIVAPGSTAGSPWLLKFSPLSSAFASGWMQVRGNRRRRALDRGFILSDHVDWEGLQRTIKETGADFVGTMHGFTNIVSRYLRETGLQSVEVDGFQERDDVEES